MASGSTCIRYGELTILNCLTKEFAQEAVFDESGADLLFFRFKVRVVGYLHGNTAWYSTVNVAPNDSSASAGSHERSIRYLLTPRKSFEMRLGASFNNTGAISGGQIILQCQPFGSASDYSNASHKDLDNGPKVRVVDVTQISGDTLLRAEFEFEICKMECDSSGNFSNTSGVLSNRWSVADEIDRNFFTTRTFSGRLRTASSRINANSFRNFVVPPLQPGMRRDSMSFQVTEDGLTLAYTIVDKEVAFSPPAPATEWSFSHTERIERAGELGFYSEVDVMLGGDRLVDKKLLISIAAAIAETKILTALNPNGCFLESISVTDEYNETTNRIYLRASGRRVDAGGVPGLMGLAAARLGRPIEAVDLAGVVAGYSRDLSRGSRAGEPIEVDGPISMVGAFAAYLQQPCSADHEMFKATNGGTAGSPGGSYSTSLSASLSSEIPDDGSLASYSSYATQAMYTFHRMESTYDSTHSIAHLPIAGGVSVGGTPTVAGPTSAFMVLAPSMTRRLVKVHSERVGGVPATLNPTAAAFTDENGIVNQLLRKTLLVATPEITADNKRVFRAVTELVFGLDRDPTAIGGIATLRAGLNPWENVAGVWKYLMGNNSETSPNGSAAVTSN